MCLIRICMTFSLILTLGKYELLCCHHFLCISTPWTKQLLKNRNTQQYRNVTALGWPKKSYTHTLLKSLLKLWNPELLGLKSGIQLKKSWIHCEESSIQDSLGFPCPWGDLSGEQHSRSSCRIFVEGKLSSPQGIIKPELITYRTMGTGKRRRELHLLNLQSHRSTGTRTRAFTFLLSPTSALLA